MPIGKTAVSGPVNGDDIIHALIRGGEKACEDYIVMSGNPLPGFAPESFIQAGAAQALKGLASGWVVLEESVAETYKAAQPEKRWHRKKNVLTGRYDIVVYFQHGRPRAAIEVKSPVNSLNKSRFRKDFTRLIKTMGGQRNASFQYGVFLLLTVKKGKKNSFEKCIFEIDALVNKLGLEACQLLPASPRIRVLIYDGSSFPIQTDTEKGAWRITAIVFKRG